MLLKQKIQKIKGYSETFIINYIAWLTYNLSIDIKLLNILMFPITFYLIIINYNDLKKYIKYKSIIKNKKNIMQFIINTFTRISSDMILGRVLVKYPECFSKYVNVNGELLVKDIERKHKGVLVVGNHGGPAMLQTLLFSKVFNIPLSSYSADWLKTFSNREHDTEMNQLRNQFPIYFTGEEKKLLKALLSGEWINILLDISIHSNQNPNCQFASHPMQLSQFPFRISLKYEIPIIYVEIKRVDKIEVTIMPIDNFSNPLEGLKKYAKYLESTIFSDNYSNTSIPLELYAG